jgi:hypothetical protein
MEKGMLIYLSHISTLNSKEQINFPHQTYMDMSDQYRLRDDNSLVMGKVMHLSILHFRCLRMDNIDVITYRYEYVSILAYISLKTMYQY